MATISDVVFAGGEGGGTGWVTIFKIKLVLLLLFVLVKARGSRRAETTNEEFYSATGNIPGDVVLFPIGDLMLHNDEEQAQVSMTPHGDGMVFRARSDIAAGEELRVNYFPRKAGSTGCRRRECRRQYTAEEQGQSCPHVVRPQKFPCNN